MSPYYLLAVWYEVGTNLLYK